MGVVRTEVSLYYVRRFLCPKQLQVCTSPILSELICSEIYKATEEFWELYILWYECFMNVEKKSLKQSCYLFGTVKRRHWRLLALFTVFSIIICLNFHSFTHLYPGQGGSRIYPGFEIGIHPGWDTSTSPLQHHARTHSYLHSHLGAHLHLVRAICLPACVGGWEETREPGGVAIWKAILLNDLPLLY